MVSLRTLFAWCAVVCSSLAEPLTAKDYVLTIGGGYAPEGNQASLEANVQFFQRVLEVKHAAPVTHHIYFADGFDSQPDTQIIIKQAASASPAVDMVREIFAPPSPSGILPGSQKLGYRNHRVSNIKASNRINDVRDGLTAIKGSLHSGDRLFIYVTAHGGSAKKDSSPFNTSISCWGHTELKMQELATWMDDLPSDVPVVMVMAQCYCGGFAQTVFAQGDPEQGLPKNIRTGFFAQRHDLPAAGCRPDIDNDEEYSSYFWGALMGQTRTGRPALGGDYDQNGSVSLAEAHAFAVIESDTIDVPTRGSDAFLRQVSRIPHYELDTPRIIEADESESDAADIDTENINEGLLHFSGSLDDLLKHANSIDQAIIRGLARRLELSLNDDTTKVFKAYEEAQREFRAARRGGFGRRGRGGFSRRRELQNQLIEKWPELEDDENRLGKPLLQGKSGEDFVAEVKQMDAYKEYVASRQSRLQSRETSLNAEVAQVLLRRLIHHLESVVLAENIKKIGTQEQQMRLQELWAVEATQL